MPVARIIAAGQGQGPPRRPHPKVELIGLKGRRVEFPFAPTQIDHGGIGRLYGYADRVGRPPREGKGGQTLEVLNFEALFAHADHQQSVEPRLRTLARMSKAGDRVRWRHYGALESGFWRITDLAVVDELRQHGTNLITRARVRFTLTELTDAGRHSGPVAHNLGALGTIGPGGPILRPATTHIVRAGDTLYGIAELYYDDGSRWPVIGDANGIRRPAELGVGRLLAIPAAS